MISGYWDYRQLIFFAFRPAFLVLDVLGLLAMIGAVSVEMQLISGFLVTAGSAFLTIGFTLPIALYYQSEQSSQSFQIIKSCDKAGIRALFVNRKTDNDGIRGSIRNNVKQTQEMFLLGIAFRSLFDPSNPHTEEMEAALKNRNIRLKVLVLDPECDAARRRENIEIGSQTIRDIEATVQTGIVSTIQSRIDPTTKEGKEICDKIVKIENLNESEKKELHDNIKRLANIEIKMYSIDPMAFIMGFDNAMLVENYHLGRPPGHPYASCIGKYLPVLEFSRSSEGYRFYRAHFNYLWSEGIDRTEEVVQSTLQGMKKLIQMSNSIGSDPCAQQGAPADA